MIPSPSPTWERHLLLLAGQASRSARLAVGPLAEPATLTDGVASTVGLISMHYDIFTRRAHVSAMRKLARLPGIWWRSRTGTTGRNR